MKGTHLARVAKAAAAASLAVPLDGVRVEVLSLRSRRDHEVHPAEALYLALEGEAVLDLPFGQYAHLRALESAVVPAGTRHRLSPVGEAVVLLVTRDPLATRDT